MKKIIIALAFCATISSCELFMKDGNPGKTYLTVTIPSGEADAYSYWDGNDKGLDEATMLTDTRYEIGAGTYADVEWLLARYYWNDPTYTVEFNIDWDGIGGLDSFDSGISYDDAWSQYWASYPSFGYVWLIDMEIAANPGTTGFLKGENGADRDYSLTLTWDPALYTFANRLGVVLEPTSVLKAEGKIVKTYDDGAGNTVTLTLTRKARTITADTLKQVHGTVR